MFQDGGPEKVQVMTAEKSGLVMDNSARRGNKLTERYTIIDEQQDFLSCAVTFTKETTGSKTSGLESNRTTVNKMQWLLLISIKRLSAKKQRRSPLFFAPDPELRR